MPWTRRIAAAISALTLIAATHLPSYHATIVGNDIPDAIPVVTNIVNGRIPFPTVVLHVVIEPSVSSETSVHWSSADGKNDLGTSAIAGNTAPQLEYDTTVGSYVGVLPHNHSTGPAVIEAQIGAPVNARATFRVRDETGIGFGCYGFIAYGPSVSIVDGVPLHVALSDADVAVVGPGNRLGTIPGYGCWGENFDQNASSYRLVFKNGGRVYRDHAPDAFVKELPFNEINSTDPLEVRLKDGRIYRLHVTPSAGTYFVGWIEAVGTQ